MSRPSEHVYLIEGTHPDHRGVTVTYGLVLMPDASDGWPLGAHLQMACAKLDEVVGGDWSSWTWSVHDVGSPSLLAGG